MGVQGCREVPLTGNPVFKDGKDGGARFSRMKPAGEEDSASALDPNRLVSSPSIVHLLKTQLAKAFAKLDLSTSW